MVMLDRESLVIAIVAPLTELLKMINAGSRWQGLLVITQESYRC
jgi:hypothetical protein